MIAVADKPEEDVAVAADDGKRPRKPLMRGWLHLGFAPALLIAGLVLTALAPTLPGRIGCAVWTLSGVQLFGTSAAYHRGNWNEPTRAVFRRLDHSNIFVFIAGTYTPLTLTLLDGGSRWVLLGLIWGIAAFGIVFRICWVGAPRWLYTLLYVAMGWAALGWLGEFWGAGGVDPRDCSRHNHSRNRWDKGYAAWHRMTSRGRRPAIGDSGARALTRTNDLELWNA